MTTPASESRACEAVVIGHSAGGARVLERILSRLPLGFGWPVVVCSHLHPSDDGLRARQLAERLAVPAVEACDKQPLRAGEVYLAPANYHLLVERERTLALSTDPRVNWSRPSIDALFESAALAYTAELVGILLSGANEDGAAGLRAIRDRGGLTVVQDPASAEHPQMPQAAVDRGAATLQLPPEAIAELVAGLRATPSQQRDRS